jgi:hypothetical protein
MKKIKEKLYVIGIGAALFTAFCTAAFAGEIYKRTISHWSPACWLIVVGVVCISAMITAIAWPTSFDRALDAYKRSRDTQSD